MDWSSGLDKMGCFKQSRESEQAVVGSQRNEVSWAEPGRPGDHRQVTHLLGAPPSWVWASRYLWRWGRGVEDKARCGTRFWWPVLAMWTASGGTRWFPLPDAMHSDLGGKAEAPVVFRHLKEKFRKVGSEGKKHLERDMKTRQF